jgi:hypothetical protein
MRSLALLGFIGLSLACQGRGVALCLDVLEAKCQKLLDCDPEGFARAFGEGADVALCAFQVEQDTAADQDPETETCEEQGPALDLGAQRNLKGCLALLPDAACQDFLNNRIEECR